MTRDRLFGAYKSCIHAAKSEQIVKRPRADDQLSHACVLCTYVDNTTPDREESTLDLLTVRFADINLHRLSTSRGSP